MKYVKILTAFAVAVLFAACATEMGKKISGDSVKSVVVGKTTMAEVRRMFGSPLYQGNGKNGFYFYQYKYHSAISPIDGAVYIFTHQPSADYVEQDLIVYFSGSEDSSVVKLPPEFINRGQSADNSSQGATRP